MTSRALFRTLAALVAGAAAMAAGAAASAPSQRLYVAATGADKLYIYDAGSNELLTSLTVGKSPHGLALSDDGRWAWVAVEGGIVKVDATHRLVVKTYPLGDLQQELEITKDGRFLYTGRLADGCYEVFDTVQEKVVAGMAVDGYPHNVVRAAGDDRFMYAAPLSGTDAAMPPAGKAARPFCNPTRAGRRTASDRIYVFDTRALKTVGTIATGKAPRPMAISADGKWLYSDVDDLSGFLVIDTARRAVVERVAFPKLTQEQKTTGSRGHGLGLTRDQHELWAASTLHDVIDVYDREPGGKVKFLTQIAVQGMPHWITFSPDGRYGYASLNDSDKVAVIDVATHKVVKNLLLPKGSGPKTIDAGVVALN
jgi:YVTN family beta-propeller protein